MQYGRAIVVPPLRLCASAPLRSCAPAPLRLLIERIEQQLEGAVRLAAEVGAKGKQQHIALAQRDPQQRVAAGEPIGAQQPPAHQQLTGDQRMLVEYKPFEPAFYHTDIADWGMALLLSQSAGPRAKVLVDTGHHYQAQNIEQIVAWLLDLDMLGGFHFNDRRYADDDLTLGSIDPYQIFRIFHEIRHFEWETGRRADIAYMIDQSHNLKGKIEAMIQTVTTAMELYAKAALVDHEKLTSAQSRCALVEAESCLKDAFSTDVRPAIREWAVSKGVAADPMDAFRQSGYLERITAERSQRNLAAVTSYA